MNTLFITETHARLRTWLATGYALFIAYGSLSPFSGWRDQGLDFVAVLDAPLRLTYTAFDATLNLLSYLPLGLLLGLTLGARLGALPIVMLTLVSGVMLSACMEYLQMYLPMRVSSNMDLLSNAAGTLAGALLAVSMTSWAGFLSFLVHWRGRLFRHGKEMDFGLAMLALWMFGQINPSLPMLGNLFISEASHQPFVALAPSPFDWWESVAVMLNLLMLGALLLTLLRAPRNAVPALLVTLISVALVKFVAAAMLLKSWALLLWINSEAVFGMLLGMPLLAAMMLMPRGAVIASGAATAATYLVIVNLVFDSNTPSATMSLYHWHYGHLLNYSGLSQTITLIFPALLLWHLWRIRKV
jgi:VanZ family protein